MSRKEAHARIKINKLLERASWRFLDDKNGPANIQLEQGVDIDSLGDNFEKSEKGVIDYLLLDENKYPLAVLEAKGEEKNPLDGKEQARKYAHGLNVRFVILSNGNIHYFWDLETGNPETIREFPSQESFKSRLEFKPRPEDLCQESVDENYIAVSQKGDIKTLRPYQLMAIKALQRAAKEGKQRFLFEMATGTGKTLLSAAVIRLFLRTGNAKRVLFLVDRIELEEQATKNFVNYLKKDYTTFIYKRHREDWNNAEIVVSTVQTLMTGDRYKNKFSPTDFDFVISDEAHRGLGGNSRAVFDYFIGYKLGLTATPRDYLKNIDRLNLSEKDQRKWEQRLLLDTYTTFGCEDSEPTFKYSIIDGVKDGFLINPVVVDARTEITTKLLSDEGYSVKIKNDDGEEDEKFYHHRDFEKKFFSEKTNAVFCQNFLDNALKDPISGEVGKSIIFCVSQNHASKINQILNKMAHQRWPDKYNSDFSVQVTSNISESQSMTINFANNRLNGYTKFLEGYKSSKTRVCVTVGMMSTGYDCPDILNLCMMRPIFSPSDFVQIKGRGTRKFSFKYKGENKKETKLEKEKFKLFDYFANCEYFEEKFKYDEALKLPKISSLDAVGDELPPPATIDEVEISDPDHIKTLSQFQVGKEGMRVDREFWNRSRDEICNDEKIKKAVEEERWDTAEREVRERYEDKPKLYLTLEKIRRGEGLDRRLGWKEVLQRIFGLIDHFPNKEELLKEECDKFIALHRPKAIYIPHIVNYLRAYIIDGEFRKAIDEGNLNFMRNYPAFSFEEYKALNGNAPWRKKIPQYVKDYIKLNTFME